MFSILLSLTLLLACGDSKSDDTDKSGSADDTGSNTDDTGHTTPDDTGVIDDTGEPQDPGHCVPDHTSDVGSLEVAEDGFDFSARAVLDSLTGTWSGTLETGSPEEGAGAASESLPLHVVFANNAFEAQAVYMVWEGPDGAEPQECPPEYTFKVPTTFNTDGGELNETFNSEWRASFISSASISVALPFGMVSGSARPQEIPNTEWSSVQLLISAHSEGDGPSWTGEVDWAVPPDEEGRAPGDDTAAPPMRETIGQFSLTR